LDKVVFKFYSDSESLKQALANRNVLAASYLPLKERSDILGDQLSAGGLSLRPLKLSQYSAVFFNQSAGSLKEKAVRQALSRATDRQRIVREALADAGAIVDSPILPGFIGYYPDIAKYDYAPNEATALLDADKWQAITPNDYISWSREQEKKNLGDQFVDRPDAERLAETSGQEYFRRKGDEVLEITLTLVDQPENLAVVKIVKENWEQIGVKINLNVIPGSDIRREAIKPRHYEALLYSEIIGYDPDPYPFWHSSQVEDPGLNLSMFVDKRVDGYIEAARQSSDVKVRAENYQKFQDILASEAPAIFLYQPDYPYVVSDQVKGLAVDNIFVPADRLLDMTKRYIKTRRSW